MPRSPECAGSAGEGRRRARQCHGLIFIPISLCCVAPLPPLPGRDAQGEGPRGAVGRSGVAHKLLRRDRESTRVGPKSVGGGSQDPVTRCLGVCEKGWSDICSKIASFLSTFSFSTRKHLKTTCITNGLWGGGGGGKGVWVGNGTLPSPTRRTSLVGTHQAGRGGGSRYSGAGGRWGPGLRESPTGLQMWEKGCSPHFSSSL